MLFDIQYEGKAPTFVPRDRIDAHSYIPRRRIQRCVLLGWEYQKEVKHCESGGGSHCQSISIEVIHSHQPLHATPSGIYVVILQMAEYLMDEKNTHGICIGEVSHRRNNTYVNSGDTYTTGYCVLCAVCRWRMFWLLLLPMILGARLVFWMSGLVSCMYRLQPSMSTSRVLNERTLNSPALGSRISQATDGASLIYLTHLWTRYVFTTGYDDDERIIRLFDVLDENFPSLKETFGQWRKQRSVWDDDPADFEPFSPLVSALLLG